MLKAHDDNALGWLLDEHLGSCPGVRFAVHMTSDGLLSSYTKTIDKDTGDKLAAVTAALRAAGLAWAEVTGRPDRPNAVRQHLIETDQWIGLTSAAAENSLLAVCADLDSDIGLISERMNALSQRVGHELVSPERQGAADGGRPR
ncbi:roadblock/LC7 domain-containing protein [Actinacidiphila guanduensis]|jgi:predicted regulator of Ras-like GTPase activity (Roadblock/LC7/MglB family)|uniref:Predicted regulator of Ras-like GTPase activity, Roadblock/LC7/MglB family n=1 Tax=Actinacidiphila guanduensis TaxID=310781 RepID=A0A1G9ZM19_9ACTN|nr:roadblock/LC7 domain-containing protein [Actinacidiphila guanduensis]SDN22177.1 Predicted regulator of Ras-like GTPase activity, Roadblock/LC7/MglB family [Actinacidiphila guanduensis]